ncbi:hypothetical protein COU37_00805 [Candidatus Micrarchaeota archaeon CG10_big_fil_rev_8_21_14_0_10_45_29]|nr:MAG: hypothetical protein COU37_00805 [Candidatus Micrarchaeota archaeon CG10_big_fil_rev_8_21_14_0_10_45_29]
MFLDANIFIKAVRSPTAPEGRRCKRQFERILSGEMNAHTSTLVLNEVHYFFLTNTNAVKANKILKNILNYHNLEILALDKQTLCYVEEFVEAGLETSDACHAATMKSNGISTICSYDKHFDKIKGIKRQTPK